MLSTRTSLVRRCCIVLVSATLVAVGGGCGSSSPSGGSISISKIQSAIDRTRQIHSVHVSQSLALVSPQGSVQGSVAGDVDLTTSTGHSSVSLGGTQVHAVFKGDKVWLSMNLPQFVQALPGGKRWVQGSAATLEALGAFHPVGDSLALLDGLRGVQTLSRTGPDSANFRFSLARALARTPAARRPALERAIHANGFQLVETGSVALTPAGTVRSETLRIDGTGAQSDVHLRVSLGLSSVGESVTATPPPSGQVVPLGSVLPSLESVLRASGGTA